MGYSGIMDKIGKAGYSPTRRRYEPWIDYPGGYGAWMNREEEMQARRRDLTRRRPQPSFTQEQFQTAYGRVGERGEDVARLGEMTRPIMQRRQQGVQRTPQPVTTPFPRRIDEGMGQLLTRGFPQAGQMPSVEDYIRNLTQILTGQGFPSTSGFDAETSRRAMEQEWNPYYEELWQDYGY